MSDQNPDANCPVHVDAYDPAGNQRQVRVQMPGTRPVLRPCSSRSEFVAFLAEAAPGVDPDGDQVYRAGNERGRWHLPT